LLKFQITLTNTTIKPLPKYNNVLLIDDNEVNNLLHERLIELSDFGKHVKVIQHAPDAIQYLLQVANQPESIPDIIFLDIRMPIMDGFGFLDAFQKMPDSIRRNTKIILLSSTLDPNDNARAALYPEVIKMMIKPLNMGQLASL
jgi:CheY-like chemotaxis protein